MSTTTNLQLFKHDTPETNTDQFDVEKALNENWDKIDENAGKMSEKIQTLNEKDTSQDTEIQTLKDENTLLRSQIPSTTVTGESIHLEDSSNMGCYISPLGASIQDGIPSIENPSPINSVGSNINEFDIESFVNKNSEYYTLTDGILNNTQIDSRSSGFDYFLCEAGTYTLSTLNACRMRIFEEGNTTPISQVNDQTSLTFTIETDKNLHFKFFNTTVPSEIGTVKIERGLTVTEYSPYEQGSICIYNGNKNWLKNKAVSQTINGITFTVEEDGTVIVNGTATSNTNLMIAQNITLKDGEEYVLSGCPDGGNDTSYAITMNQYYSSASHYIQDYGNSSTFIYNELSANSNSVYIRIVSGATINNLTFKPMIRLSIDTDDSYVPHQSQTKAIYIQKAFLGTESVKDKFIKENEINYEQHNFEEIILNGNEYWTLRDYLGEEYLRFAIEVSYGKNSIAYCNKLKVFANAEWQAEEEKIEIDDTMLSITIKKERLETEDEEGFKTFLASNNITIYRKLAIAELIPCTEEQTKALNSFNTYKNVTNLSSDSIGELEVFYYKDLATLLEGV